MANKPVIIRAVLEMLPQFPGFSPDGDQVEAIVRGWERALADFSDVQFRRACDDVVKTEKFFPSTSTIFAACKRQPSKASDDRDALNDLRLEFDALKAELRNGMFDPEEWEDLALEYQARGMEHNAGHVRGMAEDAYAAVR